MGPHFEALAREFALDVEPEEFGELPGEVGSGVVKRRGRTGKHPGRRRGPGTRRLQFTPP